MSEGPRQQPAGWYYAEGDPPGTQRYWDGEQWEGEPVPVLGLTDGAKAKITDGPDLAEPIARIGARVIDLVVWLVIGLIVRSVIIGPGGQSPDELAEISYARGAANAVLNTIFVSAYEMAMVATRRATLGKMVLGLEVATLSGAPVDLSVAVRRVVHYLGLGLLISLTGTVGLFFYLVLVLIAIVGLVFLFIDPKRQTVWDKIAGTTVVSVR
ncbi:MAG: RDD family protein [Actinomycetia bacterium]|nr:RDD family protein [Actinomycetes bacterium]